MSLRALEIAYAVFGESLRDELRRMADELERSRSEVADLLALVVMRDREIAALRQRVKELSRDKNGQ